MHIPGKGELVLEAAEMGLVLDVIVYSIVVDGLYNEGCLKEVLVLCERMRAKGVHPNIVTYNTMINGLCHERCLVQAFRMFDSLEKINVLPSVVIYSILIDAVCKEKLLQDANVGTSNLDGRIQERKLKETVGFAALGFFHKFFLCCCCGTTETSAANNATTENIVDSSESRTNSAL
ncbi:pentatricopeptide repeat-containing protein At5g57250, mitochondrial-like [Aristolochia californica]|uniref:pentatricopeptide repeat-containing protein At5g57250, mitochondrial-like n=1 Tax=Aristolochia californica TaxID=171875 RepID=UPI0035D58C9B